MRDVRAAYGGIEVLHGADLEVATGEVVALLGPNGAGKSTILKVLSGQLAASSGSLDIFGVPSATQRTDQRTRAGLCAIPEGRGIFSNLTVLENLRVMSHAGAAYREIVERAFNQFPRLAERRNQLAGTMSGGEQQMLALSRALATDPKILLLDELSMGLAPVIVEDLYSIVADIAGTGVTIVIVEQFGREVLRVAHRAGIVLGGRISDLENPASIVEQLENAYLAIDCV